MIKRKRKSIVSAVGRHMPMSADKARRVIDLIRRCSFGQTLLILELMPYRVCLPIFKLVYSAAANATHNKGFDAESLFIFSAEVNEGTAVKRLKPRARGRSSMIKRPTCHIKIVLIDVSIYEGPEIYDPTKYLKCSKKPGAGLINKNKNKNLTCHDTYSSGGLWDKK
uniref:Large ribosomal subunit protein uL22c n=1 Tax=Biebersteinia heterostemon TaxID=375289 RepID=A0A8F7GR55_9ROSI|nr:ribosomal protein L22 [Biebersteinia heterostemon]